ncbi:FecR family protein [Acinetobacter puyangensis]|uniref:FecR family protein n=1 Tax=Acinetobacter puyangensis TaxID=1096779 RepID=UPI003A4DD961
MPKRQAIDAQILEEAVDWFIQMSEQPLDDIQSEQFEAWKTQSPQHQLAWQKTQKLQQRLGNIPVEISKQTLSQNASTKFPLGKLILILACGSIITSTVYFTNQQALLADYRTPYGEQRHITLEDGSRLILNSKTAIDVKYTAQNRQIILHYGEIFIQTGKETNQNHRPFTVLGKHGTIQALGTQFDMRQQQQQTSVAVIEHAVKINTAASQQQHIVAAGQQVYFDQNQIQGQQAIQPQDLMWHKGLLVANQTPLKVFAQQIENNYGRSIKVAKDCENILISGTYPADHLERLLNALAETYPVQLDQNWFGNKITIKKK